MRNMTYIKVIFLLVVYHSAFYFLGDDRHVVSAFLPVKGRGVATPSSVTAPPLSFSLSLSSPSSEFQDEANAGASVSTSRPSPVGPNGRGAPLAFGRKPHLRKDVAIIGGGLAGLSTALYLSQIDPDRHVCILERRPSATSSSSSSSADDDAPSAVASMAAAGMLAPHSERLPKGDYLDLCLESRRMYVDFVSMVETMAQEAGPEGEQYLWKDRDGRETGGGTGTLDAWSVGYVASGGFLAPAFAGDSVATWAPPQHEDDGGGSTSAIWLDAMQVRELEPHLHQDVVGGWWFPEDASVDARRLTCSLKAACVGAGVEFLCGSHYEVTSLDLQEGTARGVWLKSGKYMSAKSILVANGAWMRNLLPVPLEPHKGQSLSLRMPHDRPPLLRRVLFAQDSYIVPKADGRIVIGATVEAGSFDPNVTPAGIMHILSHALQLVPGLAELPLEETWAGLRPTTPDKGPILGKTPWKNLFLAGGYWRNGVLLAPKTGQMLASLIASSPEKDDSYGSLTPRDRDFLRAFNWDRFTSAEGAISLAANSRYAASMYPVHTRRSGVGVAAAVGTELGSYSTARSAGEERKKDRESLFGAPKATTATTVTSGDGTGADAAFERAALLGRQDAAAFDGFKNVKREDSKIPSSKEEKVAGEVRLRREAPLRSLESSTSKTTATTPYAGSADAITVGFAYDDSSTTATSATIDSEGSSNKKSAQASSATPKDAASKPKEDLESIYKFIRDNKSKQVVELPVPTSDDDLPDPGFRIYHIDGEGISREVPPYTSPGEFLAGIPKISVTKSAGTNLNFELAPTDSSPTLDMQISKNGSTAVNGKMNDSGYDGTTYDGYQDILEANSSTNRSDELKAMKEARRKNREGQTDI